MALIRKDGYPVDLGPNISFEQLRPPSKESHQEASVLVVGSGGGAYTSRFYLEGFKKIVGIDIDPVSVKYSTIAANLLNNLDIHNCLMGGYPFLPNTLEGCPHPASNLQPSNLLHLVANALSLPFPDHVFDYTVVPWLLGVENGIVDRENQLKALEEAVRVTREVVRVTPMPIIDEKSAKKLGGYAGMAGLYEDILRHFQARGHVVKEEGVGLTVTL